MERSCAVDTIVCSKLLKYLVLRFLLSDSVNANDIKAGEKYPLIPGRISEHPDPPGN